MLKTRRHSSKNKKSMREKGMEKEKTTSKTEVRGFLTLLFKL